MYDFVKTYLSLYSLYNKIREECYENSKFIKIAKLLYETKRCWSYLKNFFTTNAAFDADFGKEKINWKYDFNYFSLKKKMKKWKLKKTNKAAKSVQIQIFYFIWVLKATAISKLKLETVSYWNEANGRK